jgi:hypothetical protein
MNLTFMSPHDEKQILRWSEDHPARVTVRLVKTADDRDKDFGIFCGELARLAPNVTVETIRDDTGAEAYPAIRIGESIRYHAIPKDKELAPFLELLTTAADGVPDIGGATGEALERLRLPAQLRLYVSPGCPFCPEVVRRMAPLPLANERLRLSVIDGSLFPEMTEADEVRAAPTLILDGTFRWTGQVDPAEVIRMAADRDPSQLSADALEGIIKEGKAEQVAEMMIGAGRIFPGFIDLLTHEKWPERLGAMVAMEYLAEADPDLAAKAVGPLAERFDSVDERVRGDLLHVFGEIGNKDLLDRLAAVKADPDADDELREAADEALAKIRKRTGDPGGDGG